MTGLDGAPGNVVLVTSRSFGSGGSDLAGRLASQGLTIHRGDPRHDIDDLAGPLPHASAWIAGAAPIGQAHLALAPRLRIIARYGVGVDGIDRAALRERGVVLTHTPDANTNAVAEHTVGLVLALLRGTVEADRAVRRGHWRASPGRELGACIVGIVGYGRIGRAVHARLRGFGSKVIATDPLLTGAAGIDLVPLDELFATADVVTLHLPEGDAPVIDAQAVRSMRPSTYVVNTARAGLIDEDALAHALHDGRLAGAALDVALLERGGPSPLLDAPNVLLTPHISGQSVEAIDRMGQMAADEVIRVVVHGLPAKHPVEQAEGLDAGRLQ